MVQSPPSFVRYLRHVLGTGTTWVLCRRMLSRSFGAKNFADFWRYWNPLYGYLLRFYCYRYLRRRLPRSLSLWLTFAASGFFLHDLPTWPMDVAVNEQARFPTVTIAFSMIALFVLVSERTNFSLSGLGLLGRSLSHSALIFVSFATAMTLHLVWIRFAY